MKFEKQTEAVKNFFIKLGKRNLIIICAILLIAAAATANIMYFAGRGDTGDGKQAGADTGGGDVAGNDVDSYFSASQLSRQRARDEALEVLQGVIEDNSAGEDAKAAALADITQMAKDMEAEANVETLVMAKGFERCVAVIGSGAISVVVDVKDGEVLNAAQIAQINTIVYEQTGIKPENTVIIEK